MISVPLLFFFSFGVSHSSDLGYGRYDDTSYSLTDVDGQVYPGRDYQNFSRGPAENSGPTSKEVIDRCVPHRNLFNLIYIFFCEFFRFFLFVNL
jgi:hypothetical protein